MVIAVDFDGTIVEHEYPQIGKPIPFAIETLKQLQKDGHILLLWTVRDGDLLQEAIDYIENRGVKFYAYNKNFPEEEITNASRKLNADIFIDDRNVGGLPEWGKIYRTIKRAEDTGLMTFTNNDYSDYDNDNAYRKKNFLIRLGEMFENNK